jgi:hypothetical protein
MRTRLGDFSEGLSGMWGALLASGIGTGAAIGARALASPGSTAFVWSEAIGLAVGVAAGGAMWAFSPSMAEAGKLGVAVTAVNQGLRLLEGFLASRNGATAGMGWPMTETLGMPSVQQIQGQMGYTMAVEPGPTYGAVPGVHGAMAMQGAMAGPMADTGQPPVNLLGSGLSRLYGATHF